MPTLRLKGLAGYDGDYTFDWTFTTREHHQIKAVSGLRPTEYLDALLNGDAGFRVAIADAILTREGKTHDVESLWDAELKQLWIDLEVDESPPDEQPPSSESSSGANDAENDTSGASSPTPSENPEDAPSSTGSPGSVTGSPSDPKTLVI